MTDIFPGSELIGEASVRGSLYDLDAHPGLLLDESGSSVVGEVYKVDDEILNKLDEIEAASSYRRKRVEVTLGSRRTACWIYQPDSESYPGGALITPGDWIECAKTKTGTARRRTIFR